MNLPRAVVGAFALALICGLTSCSKAKPSGSDAEVGEAPPDTAPKDTSLTVVGVLVGYVDDTPTDLAVDRSGNIYVAERRGVIRRISTDNDAAQPAELLFDLGEKVGDGGTVDGLLGIAITADQRTLILNYTTPAHELVLEAYPLDSAGRIHGVGRVVMRTAHPFVHKGGDVEFDADGALYVSMASAPVSTRPLGDAQNPDGVVIKLGPTTVASTVGYRPTSADVVAHGFRNPWRISLDGSTLWVADVGESSTEEIDRADLASEALNFGWPYVEGVDQFVSWPDEDEKPDFEEPVVSYQHGDGRCAAVGGLVYRSSQIRAAKDMYLFGDFCSEDILAVPASAATGNTADSEATALADTANTNKPAGPIVIGGIGRSPVSFAAGPTGDVYVAGADGAIVRLEELGQVVSTERANPPPRTIGDTERTIDPVAVIDPDQFDSYCAVRAALVEASDVGSMSPADAAGAVDGVIDALQYPATGGTLAFAAAAQTVLAAYVDLRAAGVASSWETGGAEMTRLIRMVTAERGQHSRALRAQLALLEPPAVNGPDGPKRRECPA